MKCLLALAPLVLAVVGRAARSCPQREDPVTAAAEPIGIFRSLADRLRSHAILAFGKDEVGGHVRRPINPDAQSRKRRWSICGNFGEWKCIACAQRSPGYSFGRQWYELHGDRNVACDYRPP